MKIGEIWEHTISRMKATMTDGQILSSIGHDREFFYDNKLDYNNPHWGELEIYIKSLPAKKYER